MYGGGTPGIGALGGLGLIATGGSPVTTILGIAVLAAALGLGVLLFARERRRRRFLAEQDATSGPIYRRLGHAA